jgi:hypothetical protein
VIQAEIWVRAWSRVVNRCRWMYSTLIVELNTSATALSSSEPTRAIDWMMP